MTNVLIASRCLSAPLLLALVASVASSQIVRYEFVGEVVHDPNRHSDSAMLGGTLFTIGADFDLSVTYDTYTQNGGMQHAVTYAIPGTATVSFSGSSNPANKRSFQITDQLAYFPWIQPGGTGYAALSDSSAQAVNWGDEQLSGQFSFIFTSTPNGQGKLPGDDIDFSDFSQTLELAGVSVTAGTGREFSEVQTFSSNWIVVPAPTPLALGAVVGWMGVIRRRA